jgi:MFS family permease
VKTTSASDGTGGSAFAVSNYRRFFIGQSLSYVGTWFQTLAQALLVLKLSGNGSSLGEVFAAQTLPMLLLGPFVGPYIDRANLRRVMLIAAAVAGTEAVTLGVLTATHHVTVDLILGLSFVLGFSQLFMLPSIQTFVSELVPPEAIPSAVSLNAVQNSIGRLAGPAIAAVVYAWRGAATCYFVNALSFLVVFVAICSIRRRDLYPRHSPQRSARQFFESFAYVWRTPALRGQLLANMAVGCVAFNFPIFYSSFSVLVLHHGNAHAGSITFGVAESLNAVFATIGGIVLSRRLRRPTRRTYVLACAALGGSLGLTSLAPDTAVFLADMVVFGFCVVFYTTVNQTSLQLNASPDRLGSVMALSTFGLQGTTPIGSLLAGWLIGLATARAAIGAGAFTALAAAAVLGVGLFRSRHLAASGAPAPDEDLGGTAGAPAAGRSRNGLSGRA